MAAWDYGPLDSDEAHEFIADLIGTRGDRWRMIELALALVTDSAGETESEDESAALAAAEVIASAASGEAARALDGELASWAMRTAPKHLHMLSREAIRMIDRLAAGSELRTHWQQAGDLEPWLSSLADLKSRLSITIH